MPQPLACRRAASSQGSLVPVIVCQRGRQLPALACFCTWPLQIGLRSKFLPKPPRITRFFPGWRTSIWVLGSDSNRIAARVFCLALVRATRQGSGWKVPFQAWLCALVPLEVRGGGHARVVSCYKCLFWRPRWWWDSSACPPREGRAVGSAGCFVLQQLPFQGASPELAARGEESKSRGITPVSSCGILTWLRYLSKKSNGEI